MAVHGSAGNGHQLPVGGSVKPTPCTLNENTSRQQRADSPQQQAQQQHWTDPRQQQQDLQQQRLDDSQPNTWQTAAIELCLHPQLIERQEVGPLAYTVRHVLYDRHRFRA